MKLSPNFSYLFHGKPKSFLKLLILCIKLPNNIFMIFFAIINTNPIKLPIFKHTILYNTIMMVQPTNTLQNIILMITNTDNLPLMHHKSKSSTFCKYLNISIELCVIVLEFGKYWLAFITVFEIELS
jgi:hypothetical protein